MNGCLSRLSEWGKSIISLYLILSDLCGGRGIFGLLIGEGDWQKYCRIGPEETVCINGYRKVQLDYEGGWLTRSRSWGEKKEADKLGLVVDRHFNWTEKKMGSLLA